MLAPEGVRPGSDPLSSGGDTGERGDSRGAHGGSRRPQQPRQRPVVIDAIDPDPLVARGQAADDCDRSAWDIQDAGEKYDEGVVGDAIDRRRLQADEDGVTPPAIDAGARRSRDDADVEDGRRQTANCRLAD